MVLFRLYLFDWAFLWSCQHFWNRTNKKFSKPIQNSFFFNRWQPKSFPSCLLCRVSFWLFTLFAIADIRYNCRQKWQSGRYKQNQPLESNQASSWNIQTLLNLLFDKSDVLCSWLRRVCRSWKQGQRTSTLLTSSESRWLLCVSHLSTVQSSFFSLEHPWHGVSCLFAMNPMNGWLGGCA